MTREQISDVEMDPLLAQPNFLLPPFEQNRVLFDRMIPSPSRRASIGERQMPLTEILDIHHPHLSALALNPNPTALKLLRRFPEELFIATFIQFMDKPPARYEFDIYDIARNWAGARTKGVSKKEVEAKITGLCRTLASFPPQFSDIDHSLNPDEKRKVILKDGDVTDFMRYIANIDNLTDSLSGFREGVERNDADSTSAARRIICAIDQQVSHTLQKNNSYRKEDQQILRLDLPIPTANKLRDVLGKLQTIDSLEARRTMAKLALSTNIYPSTAEIPDEMLWYGIGAIGEIYTEQARQLMRERVIENGRTLLFVMEKTRKTPLKTASIEPWIAAEFLLSNPRNPNYPHPEQAVFLFPALADRLVRTVQSGESINALLFYNVCRGLNNALNQNDDNSMRRTLIGSLQQARQLAISLLDEYQKYQPKKYPLTQVGSEVRSVIANLLLSLMETYPYVFKAKKIHRKVINASHQPHGRSISIDLPISERQAWKKMAEFGLYKK